MTVDEVLARLEALGDERVRAQQRRKGAGDAQYGVKLGDVRKVAKAAGRSDALARQLWATGILEARLVATLIVNVARLPAPDLDAMVRDAGSAQLADWTWSYLVAKHPAREELRVAWMASDDVWAARAGWRSTASRARTHPNDVDAAALLDRIEREMPRAAPDVQWTMNECLASIGIHHPDLRERAVAIGEDLGLYRDYPVSKGCTSPFAPTWIEEMVRRDVAARAAERSVTT